MFLLSKQNFGVTKQNESIVETISDFKVAAKSFETIQSIL